MRVQDIKIAEFIQRLSQLEAKVTNAAGEVVVVIEPAG